MDKQPHPIPSNYEQNNRLNDAFQLHSSSAEIRLPFGLISHTILMTSAKIPSLQTKTVCEKLAHLKTHTLVSEIGSNSHRTDTN